MDTDSSSGLPSRPRFSWDVKNVPWTDGKGNQEEYATSVRLWNTFHDKFPDSNSNKIPVTLRRIMLQFQLYGRARDICKSVSDTDIQSDNDSKAIISAIYKRDSLSVVSEVYQCFTKLLFLKRRSNESVKNFESRFISQVSKFNASSSSDNLPESLTAFILLSNAAVTSQVLDRLRSLV